MGRGKKIKVDEQRFGWLKSLYDDGYRYIMMPKKNKKEFWATKANQKKDGTFRDASNFDSFRLNSTEDWIPGDDSKNVFIYLNKDISF